MLTKTLHVVSITGGLLAAHPSIAVAATEYKATILANKSVDPNSDAGRGRELKFDTGGTNLIVECVTSLDCRQVLLQVNGIPQTATLSERAKVVFSISVPGQASLGYTGTKPVLFRFVQSPNTPRPEGNSITGSDVVSASLNCPIGDLPPVAYDKKAKTAYVKTRINGNLLSPMPVRFDENDALFVYVRVHRSALPYVKVFRASDFRQLGDVRVLGESVTIPSGIVRREALGGGLDPNDCVDYETSLRDFAPGRGLIEIDMTVGGQTSKVGGLEFAVDPLYLGMFSLGAVWTPNTNGSFSVLSNGTVTQANSGSHEVQYVLFFTYFVWGARDIEKPPGPFWHYINPTVGLSLSDITENAFAGVSVDLFQTLLFTYGVHVSHVTVLDPQGGVTVGSPLPPGLSSVPTSRQWRATQFVGVSVDLRAAVKLFRVVLGTAGAGS